LPAAFGAQPVLPAAFGAQPVLPAAFGARLITYHERVQDAAGP
jgi:hypothetical protein